MCATRAHLVDEEVLAAVCRGDEAEPAARCASEPMPSNRSSCREIPRGTDGLGAEIEGAYPLVASNHFTEPVDFAILSC